MLLFTRVAWKSGRLAAPRKPRNLGRWRVLEPQECGPAQTFTTKESQRFHAKMSD